MTPREMAEAYEEKKRKEKKYYFLKLSASFFKDKAIKKLRRLPGGDTYALITLEIFLEALENDNRIYYDGIEDSFAKELALSIDESPEAVQIAVDFLISCGWLVREEQDVYYAPKGAEMSGSISARTERRYRAALREEANKLTAPCPQVTADDRNIRERNRERTRNKKEIEEMLEGKDLASLYPDAFLAGKPKASPSISEIRGRAAIARFYAISPEDFFEIFSSRDWTFNGKEITDWACLYLCLESMARKESEGAE